MHSERHPAGSVSRDSRSMLRDRTPPMGRFMLADGRTIGLRPVMPGDGDAEQAFVGALSAASRHARFHCAVRALPEVTLRRFTQLDYRTHVAMVAEACDATIAPVIVADARYCLHDDGEVAELAIAVADAWQRVGLGRRMMHELGQYARREGVRFLAGEILASNTPMIALVRSMNGGLARHPQDAQLLRAHFAL